MSVVVRILKKQEQEEMLNIPMHMKQDIGMYTGEDITPQHISLFMHLTNRNILPCYALLPPKLYKQYKRYWLECKCPSQLRKRLESIQPTHKLFFEFDDFEQKSRYDYKGCDNTVVFKDDGVIITTSSIKLCISRDA